MSAVQAVLFDMDGTLCDSEPAWMASEGALAIRYDAMWTDHDSLQLVGLDLIDVGAYIKQRMGLDLPPAAIVDELIADVIDRFASEGLQWRPGALELVEACNAADLPIALVTMSYRILADAVVAAMPRGRFDAIVAGDEVERGKPAPDAYLAAAEALGADPRACVAIEDSPTGAASAEAAGCLVVVVPNHVAVPLTTAMVESPTLADVTIEELEALMARQWSRKR